MRFNSLKKIITVTLCFALFAVICLIPAPEAHAASTSEIKNKINDYEEKQQEIQDKIDSLESDKSDAADLAKALQEKISNLENQISLVNETISNLEDKIAEAQEKIKQKEQEVEDTKDTLKNRLRAIYIAGSNSDLQVLLSADSYSDYLAKAELMRGVTKHDTELMQKLNNDIKEINKLKASVEADQQDAKDMKSSLVSKQDELDKDYAAAQSAYNKADSAQSDLEAESEEIAAAKAEAQSEWEALINAQHSSSNSSSGSSGSSGSSSSSSGGYTGETSGNFAWPFGSSYYISCGYAGYYGHSGVDITCGGALGKPIYAAAAGKVILSKWSNVSYGNQLIIDHGEIDGDSYATVYAHCQTLLVEAGETVSQGQLIAYCGSTGNSTGPHLHFEIRVNGSAVNPMNFY